MAAGASTLATWRREPDQRLIASRMQIKKCDIADLPEEHWDWDQIYTNACPGLAACAYHRGITDSAWRTRVCPRLCANLLKMHCFAHFPEVNKLFVRLSSCGRNHVSLLLNLSNRKSVCLRRSLLVQHILHVASTRSMFLHEDTLGLGQLNALSLKRVETLCQDSPENMQYAASASLLLVRQKWSIALVDCSSSVMRCARVLAFAEPSVCFPIGARVRVRDSSQEKACELWVLHRSRPRVQVLRIEGLRQSPPSAAFNMAKRAEPRTAEI